MLGLRLIGPHQLVSESRYSLFIGLAGPGFEITYIFIFFSSICSGSIVVLLY